MGKRTMIALVALGLIGAACAVRLGMRAPARNRGAGGYVMLRSSVRDYGRETGDYPQSARELVEKVGPRLAADGGPKVSYLRDDLVLLEGAGREVEVEYHYLSKDTMPNINCLLK